MARKDPYLKALREELDAPAPPTTRSRAAIEADIAEIGVMLRGPMSNAERLCLVGDRSRLRKQLAALGGP